MTASALGARLRELLPEERVDTTAITLTVNSRDASYYEYRPKAVVRLASEAEVRGLFRLARELAVPVTFRAGGTSLSGQSVGEGIVADISRAFRRIEVLDAGARVKAEPGPTAEMVNRVLAPYGRKIGPDPASIRAARIGGIVSNNSSGMITGVKLNTYRTMDSIRFVLVDGTAWDTSRSGEHERFAREQKGLAEGLGELRDETRADAGLVALIRKKFSIKCVTGYGINALVDFEDPLDILAHLLVGSEGTLAFVSEIVFNTVPLNPERSSALLLFDSLESLAEAVPLIDQSGASAVEFLDDTSMQAVLGIGELPAFIETRPRGSAALLLDYQRSSEDEVRAAVAAALPALRSLAGLLAMSEFTTTPKEHAQLWRLREDLFAIVGGSRRPGTTVLLEDMAVPIEEFAQLLKGLKALFSKHGYTGEGQGVQFGHASAGNVHFVLTADFTRQREVDRFVDFMKDAVALVVDELNGSLKAEHGTGRAMAPFVAREWGDKAYSIMKRIKKLVDPDGLLNPGVLINDDPDVFAANIKITPPVSPLIDKCTECGFCEHVCPSRLVTMTPRGRIQASRKHLELLGKTDSLEARELWRQYQHAGINTCAADGMCATQCPVGINVADYTAELREARNNTVETSLGTLLARRFAEVEKVARGGLNLGVLANRVHSLEAITKAVHTVVPFAPVWSPSIGKSPVPVFRSEAKPDIVYFPACVSRIMGSSNLAKASVSETVLTLADRAGIKLRLPPSVTGVCCGQIWGHRGFTDGRRHMVNRLVENMWQWSDAGRVRVMCDVTSCTKTMLSEVADLLSAKNAERYRQIEVIDIVPWLLDDVMERLEVKTPKRRVALHPTCASVELGSGTKMQAIGAACAGEAVTPLQWGCCGTAGDRGFIYPELADAAQRDEQAELAGEVFDGYYSLARTCEIGLSERSGHEFESIVYLVEEATRGSGAKTKTP
ncbi:MAG: FAD-binding and (Fe-S)-binding domain-containing protein [Acidimicrobiales bacterium]|jgi:D-lactate dehydrogenase